VVLHDPGDLVCDLLTVLPCGLQFVGESHQHRGCCSRPRDDYGLCAKRRFDLSREFGADLGSPGEEKSLDPLGVRNELVTVSV